MKKTILVLCVLAAIGYGIYFSQTRDQPNGNAPGGPLTLYGNVDIRDVALGFRVSGRILEMRLEEGDRVKAGDVVAVLDKQPFTDDIALYSSQLEVSRVSRRKAEMPFQRRDHLTKIGAISAEERDDAEAVRDEAQAQVLSAEARLQKAVTNLQDTEILAPSDGIILTRVRERGAVVAAGEPVYTLALDSPVWIRTYIDEPGLGRIHPGQKARVLTDSGNEYEGHIGFISPQAEFTPKTVETTQLRTDLVYRLRVIVDNPDKGLRQGMPVTVHLAPAETGPGE
ncbi:efflux RND transporter periplasmic adaptor subunit [Desulfovibrio sp. OttesenSCG-928-M16]|nr:efflux RND transporter periplasmic adaptor subunit [Desulfovibrio sp. OttesenSCG-928-M16]